MHNIIKPVVSVLMQKKVVLKKYDRAIHDSRENTGGIDLTEKVHIFL